MQQQLSMAFLFVDECSFEPLDLAALTGVLIPFDVYNSVRDAMCQITWNVLNPPADVIPAPIELHGSSLLRNLADRDAASLDAARLAVFLKIVNIVNTHDLRIYRVAYLNRSEIATRMSSDSMLYGLNFIGMQAMLQKELAKYVILPVMDGIPASAPGATKAPRIDPKMLRAFDGYVRRLHHYRCHSAVANNISIENAHNLAEPAFADSEHSTLLQLADLASYLLLQREKEELAPSSTSSEFRRELLRIAGMFRDELIYAWRGKLGWDEGSGVVFRTN